MTRDEMIEVMRVNLRVISDDLKLVDHDIRSLQGEFLRTQRAARRAQRVQTWALAGLIVGSIAIVTVAFVHRSAVTSYLHSMLSAAKQEKTDAG